MSGIGIAGFSIAVNNKEYNKSVKAKDTSVKNVPAFHNEKKVADSAKLSKSSQNNKVISPVNICEEKPHIAEKVSKTFSNCVGGVQDATTVIKDVSLIGTEAKGIATFAKVISPIAKMIASTEKYGKFSKFINSPFLTKSVGVLGAVGGAFDIANGVNKIRKGDNVGGGFKVVGGVTGVVSGIALVAGAPVVATVAGVAGITVGITKYGDDSVKKLGWIKGKDGKNQSAFEHLGERADDIAKSVEKKTGSKILGNISKYGSGIAMVPAATVVAVCGAVVEGGKTIGGFVSKGWNWAFGK